MSSFLSFQECKVYNVLHLRPRFSVSGDDIMIRGRQFYAYYDDDVGLWVTDEVKFIRKIDERLTEYMEHHYEQQHGKWYKAGDTEIVPDYLNNSLSGQLVSYRKWLNSLPSEYNYKPLDCEITFMDEVVAMKDRRSKRLKYKIAEGSTQYYDMFMDTCYDAENREKLEWAVGSVLSGDSTHIQKFIALYGKPGTGKSTFLDIVDALFEGYSSIIDIDSLVSRTSQFGTALLRNNPLVCIQHDADLSRIEKNDVLNSLISHEEIVINEKNKPQYMLRSRAMIFIGTNEFVSINDSRQGINRRMIDVYPTGHVLPQDVYDAVKAGMKFELSAIAYHCLEVYETIQKSSPTKYMRYRPDTMIKKTNIYSNFVSDKWFELSSPINDPITAGDLYRMFKTYVTENGYSYVPISTKFRENMREYYQAFLDRGRLPDGKQARNIFYGFKKDVIDEMATTREDDEVKEVAVTLPQVTSEGRTVYKFVMEKHEAGSENVLDKELKDCPAQYSNKAGIPGKPWDECTTKLSDIITTREHYVRPPLRLICIDFDLKGPDGSKSLQRNLEAAEKWPLTYCETSKSGQGLHLYYWYDGDPEQLSRIFDNDVEIKVFTGKSSLRRRLSLCNAVGIAVISSGLPLREAKKVVNREALANEQALRTFIKRNLNKEYHAYTKPSVDYIYHELEKAYNSGMHYDVSDMRNAVLAFANNSTHKAAECIKIVSKIKWKSDEPSEYEPAKKGVQVIFDVEVYPNLLLICYKERGKGNPTHRLYNPSAQTVEKLFESSLIGFNNRKYDNHILYGRYMGYNNEDIFRLSQKLTSDDSKTQLRASFSEAYNLSYTDVYDLCAKKQSLKKWEIELGIHHQEMSFPWDQPLPKDKWDLVGDYCCNDVEATEAVLDANEADFIAREILADLSGLTVNHTNRQHATKIIFGDDKNPELNYVDLSKEFPGYKFSKGFLDPSEFDGYNPNDKKTWITNAHSVYLGKNPSEGGYVAEKEGIWLNVGLLDIESLHPSTIRALQVFGKYTKNFTDILDARLAIKHKDYETAKKMFDGRLAKYLTDEKQADKLSYALKIIINSVYGYTSASFDNPFRDPRNVDNIVAKRGALFMILLTKTLEEKGIPWVHVKTDSIKIPDITPEIVDFVKEFGKKYGYNFDHEATYREMVLLNGSTYVAKVESGKHAGEWVCVAAQYQHPYVRKTLFTKEPITVEDMCETKEVKTKMVLDFNEGLPEGEHQYEFIGRIGRFLPVKEGCGGGLLMRDRDKQYEQLLAEWEKNNRYGDFAPADKVGKVRPKPERYTAVGNTTGYRWLEYEKVKSYPEDVIREMIDMTYYRKLVDEAIANIEKYGSFDEFIAIGNMSSEEWALEYAKRNFPPDDMLPF